MEEWRNQGIIDTNQPIENVIFRTKDKKQNKDINLKCTVIIFLYLSVFFFLLFIILDIVLFL